MIKKELNKNLNIAKSDKKDEFYTLFENIKKELDYYKDFFYEKVIYCNCDNPETSQFWNYLCSNQKDFSIKKIISTYYDEKQKVSIKTEMENGILIKDEIPGNGDFRSEACLNILNGADIIITNPPFSLFREFFDVLIRSGKKFIVLGSLNMLSYKSVFNEIKSNNVWLGYNSGAQNFYVPIEYDRNNIVINSEQGNIAKFGNICWFTNINVKTREDFLTLSTLPLDNYDYYDNFNAISVDRVKNIPADFSGHIGVPITFLTKYNPDQFEIVGADFELAESVVIDGIVKKNPQRFYVKGKRKYARVVIKLIGG